MTPEFSRVVEAPRASGRVITHRIAAGAAERAALARRFDLVALDRLEAEVRLERMKDGLVRLDATLAAEVVQSCVVSLEPVASTLQEPFVLLYGDVEADRAIDLDGEAETIEPLEEHDRIDIGEAVAQQLSLSLDPFPRHPDADKPLDV
jgi:uncharacterized metal-binding protein YceD (DUF177 family)